MGKCQTCVTRRLTRRACQYVEAQAKRAEIALKEMREAQEQIVKHKLAALERERDTLRQILAAVLQEAPKFANGKGAETVKARVRDIVPTIPRGSLAAVDEAAKP